MISEIDLEKKLKEQIKVIADEYLGGDLDYKVLLTLLFYKVLSDKWLAKVEEYMKEFPETQAYILANSEYYVLYDESEQKLLTWHKAVKEREISSVINNLSRILRLNPEFDKIDVLVNNLRTFTAPEYIERLNGIINGLSMIDFSKTPSKVLNSLFMWMLSNYVPEEKPKTKEKSEKKGEEFRVTPPEVGMLLVKLLDIEPNSSVLDPALGSGSFLVYAYRHVEEKYGDSQIMLYGQEITKSIAAIAKINLILNDIKNHEIFVGDSLSNPQFSNVDYALTDPRWNQKYPVEELRNNPKVKAIYTTYVTDGFPPKNSMDWGWIQLLLYFSKKKAGIVIDNGALFRTNTKIEKTIRKEIVERDLIEAIVQLPPKIFDKSERTGVIIIFNKNKPKERKEKILFINASNEYEKHPEIPAMNRLGEKHIEKIVNVYRKFESIDGFSRVVSLDEIAKNDYNLNVTLYVMPVEEEEKIDLEKELIELIECEKDRNELTSKIKEITKNIVTALKGG